MKGEGMGAECRQVLAELERFLDCECGAQLERAIREHLGDCAPCLDRAGFESGLRAMIAAKCTETPPSGLVDRVLRALKDA